jgi:pyruvate/2-oxoglutarate dehydrogenase complex dihydrolipoamide acyltransferase (E2) component
MRPDALPVGDRRGTSRRPPGRKPPYDTRPFLKVRRGYADVLVASRRKDIVHGLFEIDITVARSAVRRRRADGIDVSFTAFLVHALAQAIDEDRTLQAYRRRRRLIIFDDVDVNTQIETTIDGQRLAQTLMIRAANRKSISELTAEIRRGQRRDARSKRRYRSTVAFLTLPKPLRNLAWRVLLAEPTLFKRLDGTVALSSIGMFGPAGGWGIPVAPPTLMITVGGVARKPRFVAGHLVERELLDVTVSVDHAVVDGAAAARFARRLTELVETAAALETIDDQRVTQPATD